MNVEVKPKLKTIKWISAVKEVLDSASTLRVDLTSLGKPLGITFFI